MKSTNCLNCAEPLSGGFQFCPGCGQGTHPHRLSPGHLFHEAVHFITHADKGIFFLIGQLAKRPGTVARAYVAGVRKKYTSPLNFFFIVAAILVFSVATFQRPVANDRAKSLTAAIERTTDPDTKRRLITIKTRSEKAGVTVSKYVNLLAMFATPLISIILWLLYRRSGYNYTEHLVANLYFSGFSNLVLALVIHPLNFLINTITGPGASSMAGNTVLGIFFIFEIIYRSGAYYHFIGNLTTGGRVKAVLANLFVVVFWVGLTSFTIYTYIRNGLWGLFN